VTIWAQDLVLRGTSLVLTTYSELLSGSIIEKGALNTVSPLIIRNLHSLGC
jgi:hypothetical protein